VIMQTLILSLVTAGLGSASWVQGRPTQRELPLRATHLDGEYTSYILDHLIARARESRGTIIVISRLGATENRRFNQRRLHNALTRLIDYSSGLPPSQVVGAIGLRTPAEGVVEFYLNGTLHYVVSFRKDRDFIVDCCWEDEGNPSYYPDFKGRSKYQFP
jgi:hypothetical protein